jgi:hypothetical protein
MNINEIIFFVNNQDKIIMFIIQNLIFYLYIIDINIIFK